MIVTAFFNFFGILLAVFFAPFVALSEGFDALPYLGDAIAWLFRALLYFRGVFPVNDLYAAISVIIVFVSWLFFFHFLFRFIGRIRSKGQPKMRT